MRKSFRSRRSVCLTLIHLVLIVDIDYGIPVRADAGTQPSAPRGLGSLRLELLLARSHRREVLKDQMLDRPR